jgi:hypothetical protein
LGQVLFYPPNVAGWPGGKSWIDSSTLMMRMRLPQLITDIDDLNIKPKADDDQMMGRMDQDNVAMKRGKAGKPIRADINWNSYTKTFSNESKENLLTAVTSTLLQLKPSFDPELIRSTTVMSSREEFIKSATIQLMSTPEYQMC